METRTRFKEDCDLTIHVMNDAWSFVSVGNQDSLQRGLRLIFAIASVPPLPPELETRTRFKEDCDRSRICARKASYRSVGNQDSLQRGLRLFSNRCYLPRRGVGLETRTRFKEDCDVVSCSHIVSSFVMGWKPGLASKRIATHTRHQKPPASERLALETRTRFKEDCDSYGACTFSRTSLRRWKPGLASKRIATACTRV